MKMISNCPCFLLQLIFLECFMFFASWSFNPHYASFESSLFFTLKILGSSLFRACSFNASLVVHFAGPPSFSFQICVILSLFFSLSQSWRQDSISRLSERMYRSRTFFPKTTVSRLCLDIRSFVTNLFAIFRNYDP